MSKPDDSSLTPEQYKRVRSEAERALKLSGAFGQLPTPVDEVLRAAEVEEVQEDVLNEGLIAKLRRKAGKAGGALKSALSKVIGLFDVTGRLVFIDRSLHLVRQTFVRLHEAGHAFLRWQRDLYAVVEDCELTINPELADLFEREANVFAAEVLFQLDSFSAEAEQRDFGILTPVRLSKQYGSSIYSAVRQYVTKNRRACAVIVLNPPEPAEGDGFRATLRRRCYSPAFLRIFGATKWPECFTPDDKIGAMVPVGGRRMTGQRKLTLMDLNGDKQICLAEAFTQSHQVFILIHATGTLKQPRILLAAE
jgi:hypothetical protein